MNSRTLSTFSIDVFIIYTFFGDLMASIFGGAFTYSLLLVSIFLMIWSLYRNYKINVRVKVISRLKGWIVILFFYVLLSNQMLRNGDYWPTARWIWAVFMMFLIAHEDGVYEKVLKTILICGMVHVFFTLMFFIRPSLYGILYNVWGYWPTGTQGGKLVYKAGLTNHYSHNAMMIVPVVILLASKVFTSNKKSRGLNIFLWFISLVALFLTMKRAHILFGAIALFIGYYAYNPQKRFSRAIKIAVILFIGAIGLEIVAQYNVQVSSVLGRFSKMGEDYSSLARLAMWELAYKLFLSSPIFGIGWGGFRYQYFSSISKQSESSNYLDAHNVYLQMLAETGIVGTIIFLVTVFTVLYATYKLLQRKNKLFSNNAVIYSFILQIFVLLYCLTGNCMYDIMFCHYVVAIGIAYGIHAKRENVSMLREIDADKTMR